MSHTYLRKLLSITNKKNYFVVGLIDSNYNNNVKKLSKEEKRSKELRKFKQKIDLNNKEKILENVNIKLLKQKKLIIKSSPLNLKE